MSDSFDRLIETVAALRAPGGCPWDREQTHQSLKRYFVEEVYEALQAIDDGDDQELKGELGDVLLQVALHAQIADEGDRFNIDDVCEAITEKLVRRHPHVFGSVDVDGVDQVLTNWEAIKDEEKGLTGQESALDGIPQSLPSLLLALEVSKKAARLGFEWPDIDGVFDKMHEEISELKGAMRTGRAEEVEAEIGDLLFTIVNIARWSNVDPEISLRSMVRRFSARFQAMEDLARAQGRDMETMSLEEWDALWTQVKQERP